MFLKVWLLTILTGLALAGAAWAAPEDGPSGGAVVFVAGEGAEKKIMMTDPEGSPPVMLVDFPGIDTQPAVGPDGQLAWVNRNGSDWNLMENGRVVSAGGLHLSPAYSPDGSLAAAYSGPEETSIFWFREGVRTPLIFGENGLAVSPVFSPDGRKLAFILSQETPGRLYLIPVGGGPARAVTEAETHSTDPAWSPDGRYLAFVAEETDIYLIRPDGRGLKRLTEGQGRNSRPSFSPDGRRIVFSSDRHGRPQLFVMDLDGRNQRLLLPDFPLDQTLPVWSARRPEPAAVPEPEPAPAETPDSPPPDKKIDF